MTLTIRYAFGPPVVRQVGVYEADSAFERAARDPDAIETTLETTTRRGFARTLRHVSQES